MEIILKENIENLGFKDDIVKVKTDMVATFLFLKERQLWLLSLRERC